MDGLRDDKIKTLGALLVALLLACDGSRGSRGSRGHESPGPPVARAGPLLVAPDLCLLRLSEIRAAHPLPGAPTLQRSRVEILGRARAVPVVFARTPQPPAAREPQAIRYAAELAASDDPAATIFQTLRKTSHRYDLRRAIFLREGYLYADEPHLGLRLSQVLRLDHLFDAERIVIHRGGQVMYAARHDGRYYRCEAAGRPDPSCVHVRRDPAEGQAPPSEASLLLFDRVAEAGKLPSKALHADFSDLRAELAFERAYVERITDAGWLVRLTTGTVDSWAVVDVQDGKARLECEYRGRGSEQELFLTRSARLRRARLIEPILAAAHDIISRGLPFDEPRTEEGQQDGLLRIHFRKAYREYRHVYEFNGDRYYVFDGFGRPLVPEVCIDFITDALDWGTGGRYASRGERREQVRGALDFKSFGLENPRSVEQVAEFAASQPEWFDMDFIPEERRVKFIHRARFFAELGRTPGFYERGDIVFILGLRDDERFHYHSFFIDELDPITSAPILLAANAGPPQLRTWEGEMHNAPLRSIVARLRLKTELLEAARKQVTSSPGVPLTPPRPVLPASDGAPSTPPGDASEFMLLPLGAAAP